MMNIEYPANAQFAANQIITILNADMLNPEIIHALIFNFESDENLVKKLDSSKQYIRYNIIE